MKNKLFLMTVLCLVGILWLSGCAPQGATQETLTPPTQEKGAGLANPASVHCEEEGYRVEIRTAPDGSQYGACVFPDGSECVEWAYYRGECEPGALPPDLPVSSREKVVEAARGKLAEQLNVDADSIEIVSTEAVNWGDACLELAGPEEACSAVITPGFKIVFSVQGETYVFHADETGNNIRQEMK